MTAHPTKGWWMTFCDGAGNSYQVQLHELFVENRARLVDGSLESLPVGMAATQEQAQGVGLMMKRMISAARTGDEPPESLTTEDAESTELE